jgi:hypothetical protein
MDEIQNTLVDPSEGYDFVGTPTRGVNKLVTQFSFFSTDSPSIQNSLIATDIIENTL